MFKVFVDFKSNCKFETLKNWCFFISHCANCSKLPFNISTLTCPAFLTFSPFPRVWGDWMIQFSPCLYMKTSPFNLLLRYLNTNILFAFVLFNPFPIVPFSCFLVCERYIFPRRRSGQLAPDPDPWKNLLNTLPSLSLFKNQFLSQ